MYVAGEATSLPSEYGEWTIDDGSGPATIDDQLSETYDPTVGWSYEVIGPVDHAYGLNRVVPPNEEYIIETPQCLANDALVSCDGGSYQGEVSWTLMDSNADTLVAAGGAPYYEDMCLVDNILYVLHMNDSYGDGWNGDIWQVYDYDADSVTVSYTHLTLPTKA